MFWNPRSAKGNCRGLSPPWGGRGAGLAKRAAVRTKRKAHLSRIGTLSLQRLPQGFGALKKQRDLAWGASSWKSSPGFPRFPKSNSLRIGQKGDMSNHPSRRNIGQLMQPEIGETCRKEKHPKQKAYTGQLRALWLPIAHPNRFQVPYLQACPPVLVVVTSIIS